MPRRTPDLVISDLKMPRLNGDEVLRRARNSPNLQDLKFVIFTSSDEADDVERCTRLGATAYCKKPVDYQEYIECVRDIVKCWLTDSPHAREPFCLVDEPKGTRQFSGKVL
jgi:CheY-like chemotaxis protein